MTAMGVRFQDDAECVGVLVPVDDTELAQFDKREKGYDRVPLYLGDVEAVPFLDQASYYDDDESGSHKVFLQAKQQQQQGGGVKIWMYMQRELAPPAADAPIAQSYVDTILRGCLTISEDFAHQFLRHTKGWTPNELLLDDDMDSDNSDDEENDDSENDNESTDMDTSSSDTDSVSSSTNSSSSQELSQDNVYWVNDRHNPIYSRGDQDYMLQHARKLDKLLEHHRDEFAFRRFRHAPTKNTFAKE